MDPSPEPATVESILRSKSMTREQKIDALRELAYDVREGDVATEEGMQGVQRQGARIADLPAIQRALRDLGADEGEDTNHKQ